MGVFGAAPLRWVAARTILACRMGSRLSDAGTGACGMPVCHDGPRVVVGRPGRCGVSPLEWVAPHVVGARERHFPSENFKNFLYYIFSMVVVRYSKFNTMKKDAPTLRDAQLSCYVTPEDAKAVKTIAQNVGFKSTSQMLTAIVERLVMGGFSPAVFLKVGMQIQRYAKDNGRPAKAKFFNPFRPLPALPEQHISPEQFDKEIAHIRDEEFNIDGSELAST